MEIQKQVKLSQYTTLKVGGEAARLVEVTDVTELPAVLREAREGSVPPLIIGSGSNVLASDEGYVGTVLVIKNRGIEFAEVGDEVLVTCAAGELLDDVVAKTVEKNLWGLENLSAIPGTVGATPIQNVGAYGVEVGDVLVSVVAYGMDTGEIRTFSANDCQFGYRTSLFKTVEGKQWLITAVTFRLSKLPKPVLTYGTLTELVQMPALTPQQVRNAVIEIRNGKFPDWKKVGTAGSFFKNPIISEAQYTKLKSQYADLPGFVVEAGIKIPLGYVLDKICNLKGYRKGNVRLFEQQALVLVAENGASSTEIKNFANEVSEVVKEKTNITIEPEVTFV